MFKLKKVVTRFMMLGVLSVGFGFALLSEIQAFPYCPPICVLQSNGTYLTCESKWNAQLRRCLPTTNCQTDNYNLCELIPF